MYVKTQWVNNTTPINETNLNKIEQGIYDNSLVVDAVTNTLNPTDTETYKTAELTEGQITDVIGVSDIVIKGQTEQDGTPTPSAPVDVNVVSGSNVINTSNKNLAQHKSGYINSSTGVFNSSNDDCFYFPVVKGETYYCISTGNRTIGAIYNNIPVNGQACIAGTNINNISKNGSFVASATGIMVIYANTPTSQSVIDTFMITRSSTATAYEPHQGKELPLDLPVENLIDIEGFTSTSGQRIISNVTTGQTINGLFVKPGNYTASFKVTQLPSTDYRMQLVASSDSTQTQSGADLTNILKTETISCYNLGNYSIGITVTQACYLYLRCVPYGFTIKNIQIEKGSKNAYTPYGTAPIELCKIGNYQDYFYKSGSKWYLHKGVGKVVLNGTETWTLRNQGDGSTTISFNHNISNIGGTTQINNRFANSSNSSDGNEGLGVPTQLIQIYIQIKRSRLSTLDVAGLTAWLASNNVTLYYVLATATNTEITDTTLISQLEAIYNAPLYEQTNITQENNDLPMVLDITACKDNINGIKAFIRK